MSLTVSAAKIVEESDSPLLAAPPSWQRRPLGEVASILNGFAFSSKQFVADGGMPLIRIRDIFNDRTAVGYTGDFNDRYIVHKGDLLVGMDGDFNCSRWNGPKALLNQRVCKIEPNPSQLDIDFLSFVLPGYLKAIHEVTSSTTVTHLSSRDVAELPIPMPPLAEQRNLACLCKQVNTQKSSSAVHVKSARRAMERFRQAVLAAACTGRLTAGWRESNVPRETAEHLISRSREKARRVSKKTIESGAEPDWIDLPATWCWANLSDLTDIQGGIQKQPKRTPKSNAFPYLRVANVGRGRLDLTEIHQFELFNGELETYRLEPGDLLVVEGNGSASEIGRAAIWHGEIPDCVHQNHIIRVRSVAMLPEFIELFWNCPVGAREIASLAVTSAGLYSLSTKKIGSVPVPVAPLEEQAEIVRRVDQLLGHADAILKSVEQASNCVDQTAQAVLAKAFRGELVADVGENR